MCVRVCARVLGECVQSVAMVCISAVGYAIQRPQARERYSRGSPWSDLDVQLIIMETIAIARRDTRRAACEPTYLNQ